MIIILPDGLLVAQDLFVLLAHPLVAVIIVNHGDLLHGVHQFHLARQRELVVQLWSDLSNKRIHQNRNVSKNTEEKKMERKYTAMQYQVTLRRTKLRKLGMLALTGVTDSSRAMRR